MTAHRLSDRKFGFVMTAVLLVITGVGWFVFDTFVRWAPIGAGVIGLTALVAPGILLPFNRLWEALARRLSAVVNFVLLAAFFYLLVLPLGLIIRLFGHDPLRRDPDHKADSYWTAVSRHTDDSTLHDMF